MCGSGVGHWRDSHDKGQDRHWSTEPDGASDAAQRAAFREASLRWHPDKFVQRFGEGLAPADRERTLARVQSIAQELNGAWSGRKHLGNAL